MAISVRGGGGGNSLKVLPLQPNSYIILPPLNKLPPHSYNILPPLAAQLLPHFTPSGQITPSLLHSFTTLGSPTLTSFYPLTLTQFYPPWQHNSYIILPPLKKLPPHSHTILPLMAAQLLYHFTPSEKITPLTLTPFYTPWQPNFYLILPPLDKLPPHSYTILPPIAAHSYMAISVRGVIP